MEGNVSELCCSCVPSERCLSAYERPIIRELPRAEKNHSSQDAGLHDTKCDLRWTLTLDRDLLMCPRSPSDGCVLECVCIFFCLCVVCVCVLLQEHMEHVCSNDFFSWTWQPLTKIRSAAYCVCVCVCVCVCPVSCVGECSDSVSPLCVIPGDTAKESSLYSRPAEPPPALNKDTGTQMPQHTHT